MNRHITILILVALAFGLTYVNAEARTRPYKWPVGKPIMVENRLGAEWMPFVKSAGRAWDKKSKSIRFVYVIASPKACPFKEGRIVICWNAGLPTDRSAEAETHAERGKIIKSKIRIRPTGWNEEQLLHILGHEIGHSLGLTHVPGSKSSIMNITVSSWDVLGPTGYDRNSLKILYKRRR